MACVDCAFFFPRDNQAGECRESPPKAFVVPVRTMQGDGIGFQATFPQVPNNVWCGAFEQKTTPSQVIPEGIPLGTH